MSCCCRNFPLVVKLLLDACFLCSGKDPGLRKSDGNVPSLTASGTGVGRRDAPGRSLLVWEGWGRCVLLRLQWRSVSLHAKCTPPFSWAIVFTSDFSTCLPDLPETLNLPNASLPSRNGLQEAFPFYAFWGAKPRLIKIQNIYSGKSFLLFAQLLLFAPTTSAFHCRSISTRVF